MSDPRTLLLSKGDLSRREYTRASILEAAERMFLDIGYEAASLRELARRSGLSGPSVITHHFKDMHSVAAASTAYRGSVINLYRQLLIQELGGYESLDSAGILVSLLRPYGWSFIAAGSCQGIAATGLILARVDRKGQDLPWTHAGVESFYSLLTALLDICMAKGSITKEQFSDRAIIMSQSLLATYASMESGLVAREGGGPDEAAEIWNRLTRSMVNCACSVFSLPHDSRVDEAMNVAMKIERDIGIPDWPYIAAQLGAL